MCTVTYLPLRHNNFILTSNRDVPFARDKGLHPKTYIEDDITLTYPKDGKAGGAWIGISSKNRLICLLNGGYVYHTSRAKYRKSRGLIVKELLKATDILNRLEKVNLNNIEQFTLVIIDWQKDIQLIEFVWDGTKKHINKLPQEPYIWSSSTLYDPSVKQMRKDWFNEWIENNEFTQKAILDFHHNAGVGDCNIDVIMNRGLGGTVSITSVKKAADSVTMFYEDVLDKSRSILKL